MNRREFVAASTAVAAALACRAPSADATGPSAACVDVACVLFDRRFEASRAFGAAADRLGRHVLGIDGDVTSLWMEHLEPLWRETSGAVAGMTTAASLLCLEQLAANHWLRVIARVEHRPEGDHAVSHRIGAAPQWQRRLRAGLQHRAGPQHFVSALLAPDRSGAAPSEVRMSGSANPAWGDMPPLISWYMAGRV